MQIIGDYSAAASVRARARAWGLRGCRMAPPPEGSELNGWAWCRRRAWWPLPPLGLNRGSIGTQTMELVPEVDCALSRREPQPCRVGVAEQYQLATALTGMLKITPSSHPTSQRSCSNSLPLPAPTRGAPRGRAGSTPRAPRPTELQVWHSCLRR